jgi:hypothetical protein
VACHFATAEPLRVILSTGTSPAKSCGTASESASKRWVALSIESGAMSHVYVGMIFGRGIHFGKKSGMPTQAWDMAPSREEFALHPIPLRLVCPRL